MIRMKRGALAHYHFTVFVDPWALFFESLCGVPDSRHMELFSELILALLNQFSKKSLIKFHCTFKKQCELNSNNAPQNIKSETERDISEYY